MKYLCLAYEEESVLDDLSPDDWDDLRRETIAYVDTLRANGHLLSTHALKSVRTAMTVAETKEALGGFFLIEAADLNEAVRLAARWPSARLGSIEVRPIEESLPEDRRYGRDV